jgi:hypothetical protein
MNIVDKTTQDLKALSGATIFLAGPCPRGSLGETQWQDQWHGKAVEYLELRGFKGNVCIPLPYLNEDFEKGVVWEDHYLNNSNVILFWVPRDLDKLPGFTTNVEFGEYLKSGKCVLAYPEDAPKMRYLAVKAKWHGIPIAHTMEEGIDLALKKIQEP